MAGVSVSTVKRWKDDPEFDRIRLAVAACYAIARAGAIEETVGAAVKTAEERIKAVFDRSLKLTERLITAAEAKGDLATTEELMEIHKNITIWSGKYTVSEAPKRMEIDKTSTETKILAIVGLGEAKNILERQREVDALNQKLIAGAVDITPIAAN